MAQQGTLSRGTTPFSIDLNDELPVSVQLSWRLRALILTGRLAAGERLPSFRRLAEWAGVNVNTVRAVYRTLEEEGLVCSRQGQGTFVADGVKPAPALEEIAASALSRAQQAGLDLRDLALVTMACASLPEAVVEEPPRPAELPGLDEAETIEVRHELRRQIGRLEAELASYTRDLPKGLPTARKRAEAHVADVGELEQTRDTLIAQLSEAQKAAELRARREGEARARRRELAETDDQDTQSGAGGPLGKAMSWWRDKP